MSSYHCSINAIKECAGEPARGIPSWLLARIKAEKELRFAPHPFRNVSQMCETLGLAYSKFALGWRLTEYVLGSINGLPKSRGRIIATDGCMCLILQYPIKVYIGHFASFVPDEVLEEPEPIVKKSRKEKLFEEFDLCFNTPQRNN